MSGEQPEKRKGKGKPRKPDEFHDDVNNTLVGSEPKVNRYTKEERLLFRERYEDTDPQGNPVVRDGTGRLRRHGGDPSEELGGLTSMAQLPSDPAERHSSDPPEELRQPPQKRQKQSDFKKDGDNGQSSRPAGHPNGSVATGMGGMSLTTQSTLNGSSAAPRDPNTGGPAIPPTVVGEIFDGNLPYQVGVHKPDDYWPGLIVEAPWNETAFDREARAKVWSPNYPDFTHAGEHNQMLIVSKHRPMIVLWCYRNSIYVLPMGTHDGRGLKYALKPRTAEDRKLYVCVKDSDYGDDWVNDNTDNPYVTVKGDANCFMLHSKPSVELDNGGVVSLRDEVQTLGRLNRKDTEFVLRRWHQEQNKAQTAGVNLRRRVGNWDDSLD